MNDVLATRIEKESISTLSFPNDEVLLTEAAQKERMNKLQKGLELGNSFKNKTTITFETLEGLHEVKTTLWAVTRNHVLLKGGVNIPIHAITHVLL